ncbi:MAG TPA: AsnC family transcriptional regulator [Patescibacteria group bacterium]|nr:AsnC family transcriptional regulator [Patescibacteria group bacterium]
MDDIDRLIINELQGGFPIASHPFAVAAQRLGLAEGDLIARIAALRADGTLTRFGPLYNAEAMGGGLTLAAMQVPAHRFDEVAAQVNAFPEVAHNYAREHALNMWFVVATETPERIASVLSDIKSLTGLEVYDMPKTEEFFLSLRFEA